MAVKLNRKKTEHYVDNKVFLEEMKKYRKKVLSARKRNRKDPPINDYIGECFLKIANHLSYRPNFINYTYKEDMISDGIENCLTYVANFDPEKIRQLCVRCSITLWPYICSFIFSRYFTACRSKQIWIFRMDSYTCINLQHSPTSPNKFIVYWWTCKRYK